MPSTDPEQAAIMFHLKKVCLPASSQDGGGSSSESGGCGWLPVAPLLSLIAEYALSYTGVLSVVCENRGLERPHYIVYAHPQKSTTTSEKSATGITVISGGKCSSSDDGEDDPLLVADCFSGRVVSLNPVTGLVTNFVGGGQQTVEGERLQIRLNYPRSIAADLRRPNVYYISDAFVIWKCDESGHVSIVAGGGAGNRDRKGGYRDGVGGDAQFGIVSCVMMDRSSDGRDRLLVSDYRNSRLRAVDLATRTVTTVAGDGREISRDGIGLDCSIFLPLHMAYSRLASDGDRRVLFITAAHTLIRRYDIETGAITTLTLNFSHHPYMLGSSIDLYAIQSMSTGTLLVSCVHTNLIFAVNPITGEMDPLVTDRDAASGLLHAGGALARAKALHVPTSLLLSRDESCVYISDTNANRICKLTLWLPRVFN